MSLKPGTLLALLAGSMACWLERSAAAQIEYLKAENRALRTRLGRRRILFTNAERRTLAALAKEVGRRSAHGLCPLCNRAGDAPGEHLRIDDPVLSKYSDEATTPAPRRPNWLALRICRYTGRDAFTFSSPQRLAGDICRMDQPASA